MKQLPITALPQRKPQSAVGTAIELKEAPASTINISTVSISPTSDNVHPLLEGPGFLRLPNVLKIIPVGRSTWFAGVAAGIYPAPVPLGIGRAVGYRKSDIAALVTKLEMGGFRG